MASICPVINLLASLANKTAAPFKSSWSDTTQRWKPPSLFSPTASIIPFVILDGNVACGATKAIKTARARLLYLPKYSPDLNPIELAFSKLKTLLRKAAERTIPGLCRRIGKLIAAFSAGECTNYFSHAAMFLNDRNPL
jgi:hypothetical protein